MIEKCSYHNSHLKGKVVYGHQILVTLLACDGLVLPYSMDLYDKNSMSKIELSSLLIKSLPKPYSQGYILCDSWYSCKAVFDAAITAGFGYIGALKTNRVVFPEHNTNLGIKLSKLGASLSIEDFDLVTVKDQEYYIYSYQGKLKDIKSVSIVLSYPKDAFQHEGALKTFISLDLELTPFEILMQYTDRWAIEPFFRDCKTYLGLDGYQIRSERSILRYLLIMTITYTYCKLSSRNGQHFNTGCYYRFSLSKINRYLLSTDYRNCCRLRAFVVLSRHSFFLHPRYWCCKFYENSHSRTSFTAWSSMIRF
ncbi:DDE family transposase, partial [Herbinix hemicellulosilytica]